MAAGRVVAVLIVAVIAAVLWFGVFPWLSLHVPVDGSAIKRLTGRRLSRLPFRPKRRPARSRAAVGDRWTWLF